MFINKTKPMRKIGDKVKVYGYYGDMIFSTVHSIQIMPNNIFQYYTTNTNRFYVATELYRPTQEEIDLYYN